jgi:hypothetical protein
MHLAWIRGLQAFLCSSGSPYHSSVVDAHGVCSVHEGSTCEEGKPNVNKLCCGYLEYLLTASCEGLPSKAELSANLERVFTCVKAASGSDTCHDPPRLLLTHAFSKGPQLTERVQGQGIAVVGSSAYFFGGGHPNGVLSDEFWRLDGSEYPPIRIDLSYVSRHSSQASLFYC